MLSNALLRSQISNIYAENSQHTTFTRQQPATQHDIHEHTIKIPHFHLTSRREIKLHHKNKYELVIDNNHLIRGLPVYFATNGKFAHDVYHLMCELQNDIPLAQKYQDTIINLIKNNPDNIDKKRFSIFNPATTYYTLTQDKVRIMAIAEFSTDTMEHCYNLTVDCAVPSIILPAHYNSHKPEKYCKFTPEYRTNKFAQEIFQLMQQKHVR